MDPVSFVVAAGAAAGCIAFASIGDAKATPSTSAITLPDQMASDLVPDSSTLVVLAVSLGRAELAPELAGGAVRVQVRYGARGESVSCDVGKVEVTAPSRPAAASFVRRRLPPAAAPSAAIGATSLFATHYKFDAAVRIRFRQPGLFGKTLCQARFTLTPKMLHSSAESLLTLEGAGPFRSRTVGTLGLRVSALAVTKGELRRGLAAVDAQQQRQAFLAGAMPICAGTVCRLAGADGARDADEAERCLRGELISRPR